MSETTGFMALDSTIASFTSRVKYSFPGCGYVGRDFGVSGLRLSAQSKPSVERCHPVLRNTGRKAENPPAAARLPSISLRPGRRDLTPGEGRSPILLRLRSGQAQTPSPSEPQRPESSEARGKAGSNNNPKTDEPAPEVRAAPAAESAAHDPRSIDERAAAQHPVAVRS